MRGDTIQSISAESRLQAFVKTKASLSDEEVVVFHSGLIFMQINLADSTADYPAIGGRHHPTKPILKFAGYNIGRGYYDAEVPVASGGTAPGYYYQSRTFMLYLDPESGKIIDRWQNPWIPLNADGSGGRITRDLNVYHVQIETGNQIFSQANANYIPDYVPLGPDRVVYKDDIMLQYPSSLAGDTYRRFSANDTYQSVEVLHYYVNRKQLLDPVVDCVIDMQVSWVRLGPYLPWMHMGSAPGRLLYIADGYKVPGGFEGLPEWMKGEVRAKYPLYSSPPAGAFPEKYVNDSSWTAFKKALDSGQYKPTPIP